MGTAMAVLGNFETDRWDADVYSAIALASRLSALVKSRAALIKFAFQLRKLNSSLSNFFVGVRSAIEKGDEAADVTPERIQEADQALKKLHGTLKALYIVCKRYGLTNSSITAGQLNSMAKYADDVLELEELLQLSLSPEIVQAIYRRAESERERGEVFELSQVE
jgi:hypothetical protein